MTVSIKIRHAGIEESFHMSMSSMEMDRSGNSKNSFSLSHRGTTHHWRNHFNIIFVLYCTIQKIHSMAIHTPKGGKSNSGVGEITYTKTDYQLRL